MGKKRRDSRRASRKLKRILRELPLGGFKDTVWDYPNAYFVADEDEEVDLFADDEPEVLEIN